MCVITQRVIKMCLYYNGILGQPKIILRYLFQCFKSKWNLHQD